MFLYNSEFDKNLQYWNADRLYNSRGMFGWADKMNAKGWSSSPSKSDFGKIRITDRSSLETAVAQWLASEDAATEAYGDINKWDVAGVTDFSNLFENSDFNSDISSWDVSNGVNFDEMFLYAYTVSYTHLTLPTKRIV